MGPKAPINPMQDLMQPTEPPIIVPPKMNPEITQFFPLSESFRMNSIYKNFPCIWPTYIDSNKTSKEGRRISKEDAVANPSVLDISEVLQSMNVRHAVQPFKGYPRDVESRWDNPGRVLYDLEQMREKCGSPTAKIVELEDDDDDDEDCVPSLSSEELTQTQCWRMISRRIEGMPGRVKRLEEAKKKEEEANKKAREDARMRAVLNSKKQTSTSGSSKKKGKKKK